MARKLSTTNPEVTPAAELRSDVVEVSSVLAAVTAEYGEERDLVNQLFGQIQMSRAISKFTDVVSLQKLKHIKETKMYRVLAGQKGIDRDGNEISDVGTFEGFCRAIGVSVSKVDEDITNLKAFGEDALEQLTRIGAGYRELRQFRKLPEDQKTALIEVAKTGDKESFVELAEEIITKNAKEKEALTKRAENAEADLEARSRVLEDKNAKIDQIAEEMAKLKKHVNGLPPDEIGAEIRKEVTGMGWLAEGHIMMLRAGLQTLVDHTDEHGISHSDFMAGILCQLELAIVELRAEFMISISPEGGQKPAWLRSPDEIKAEMQNI